MEGDGAGGEKTEAQIKAEQAKAELEAIKLKTQEEAAKAAEAGKKEGKKKMGYLARGVKSKYLEKAGNLQLPAEEQRRREELHQPAQLGVCADDLERACHPAVLPCASLRPVRRHRRAAQHLK